VYAPFGADISNQMIFSSWTCVRLASVSQSLTRWIQIFIFKNIAKQALNKSVRPELVEGLTS